MIAIGCDHGGFALKEEMKNRLLQKGYEIKDFGCYTQDPVEYPDVAKQVSAEVAKGGYEFGILFCGTGIGMSIIANKHKGIRAALCCDCYSARMAKEHNNANIITLGGRTLGTELAFEIIQSFANAEFQGGIHAPRVEVMNSL